MQPRTVTGRLAALSLLLPYLLARPAAAQSPPMGPESPREILDAATRARD